MQRSNPEQSQNGTYCEAVSCVHGWPHESLFRYIMLGIDTSITPIAIDWITQCPE